MGPRCGKQSSALPQKLLDASAWQQCVTSPATLVGGWCKRHAEVLLCSLHYIKITRTCQQSPGAIAYPILFPYEQQYLFLFYFFSFSQKNVQSPVPLVKLSQFFDTLAPISNLTSVWYCEFLYWNQVILMTNRGSDQLRFSYSLSQIKLGWACFRFHLRSSQILRSLLHVVFKFSTIKLS